VRDDGGTATTDLRPARLARRTPGTHLHRSLQVPPPRFGRRRAPAAVVVVGEVSSTGPAPLVAADDELRNRVPARLRELP
jgi:hypothetical protein